MLATTPEFFSKFQPDPDVPWALADGRFFTGDFEVVLGATTARGTKLKVGDRLYFNIFGGRYRYLLELLVERKEPVELESGKVVEAYKIIPFIQNTTKGGYAERLNEATIWISADERRLPIKLSSKIAFGSVYMELIQDKHGTQSTAAEPGQSPS